MFLSYLWPNGGVFVYELNDCGFESRFSHLEIGFRYLAIVLIIWFFVHFCWLVIHCIVKLHLISYSIKIIKLLKATINKVSCKGRCSLKSVQQSYSKSFKTHVKKFKINNLHLSSLGRKSMFLRLMMSNNFLDKTAIVVFIKLL